jgi:uncharacterized protein YllA (UPF0747 family)
LGSSFLQQFIENIGKTKQNTTSWAKGYSLKKLTSVWEVLSKIGTLLIDKDDGSLTKEEETMLRFILRKNRICWKQRNINGAKKEEQFGSVKGITTQIIFTNS